MDIIVADKLTKRFGARTAVDALSFTVPQGAVVGFLGPNGAGKSTTLRILAGLLAADSGYAQIAGHPLATQADAAQNALAYLPELNPLPEELRVEEYLYFRAQLRGLSGALLRGRIASALEQVDLQRTLRREIIGHLSRGMRQRVGLADCLIGKPSVLLLDEPTTGLDPHQARGFRELLVRLKDAGQTVLLSSHSLAELERSCDSWLIINSGHLIAQGTLASLQRNFSLSERYHVQTTLKANELSPILETLSAQQRPLRLTGSEIHLTDPSGQPLWQHTLETSPGPHLGAALAELCTANGHPMHEIHRLQANLESLFFTATRKSWQENG